jgi:hypothetical protein
MTTVKISQLPLISQINVNTSNTLFVGVDVPSDTTGKITAATLAAGLYANTALAVGNNQIIFPDTIGQFSGNYASYMQVNQQNFNPVGSSDYILTADTGTNVTSYIDLGINNSQWNPVTNQQTSQYPLDGYLIVQGDGTSVGNLVIGTATTGANVVFAVGGYLATNIVTTLTANGLVMNTNTSIVFADGTKQVTAAASNAYTQAAFALANTNTLSIAYINGVNASQNTLDMIQTANIAAAFNTANSALASTVYLQGALNSSNTQATLTGLNVASLQTNLQSAWNLANTAVQNTANIILPGNVTFNGANTNFNSNIVTYGTMTTTGNVVTTGNLIATGPVTFNGNFVNNGQTTNNGNTINTGNLTTTGNVVSVGYLTANGQSTFNGNTTHNGYVSVANNLTVNNVFTINVASQLLTMNGIVTIQSSTFSSNSSGVRIDGSNNGVAQATTSTGTMLQVVGLDGGYATRILLDNYSYGNASAYPLFAGRAARGNSLIPAPVQTNDILFRLGGQGYGNTYTLLGGAAVSMVALENYTDATKGSQINLETTPIGTNTRYTTVSVNTSVVTVNTNLNVVNTIVANTYVFSNTSNTGAITQSTSKSTAVTANGTSGQITMNNAQLTHATSVVFTVNNSYVQHVNDMPMVVIQNPVTAGQYVASIAAVRVGSFDIMVSNLGAGPAQDKSDAIVLNWALMRVGS